MKTIRIPDRLLPSFADWVKDQGLHLTYRDETMTAQERHGNSNIFPMPKRRPAPAGKVMRRVLAEKLMNRLETAQYIADEFIDIKGKVIKVRQTGNPLEFKLIFEDGTTHKVTGLFAVRLQKASDSRMRVMLEDRMNINEVKPGDTLTTRDSGSSYIVISITGNNITLSHDEMNGEIDVFLHDLPEMFMDVEA